MIFYMLRTSALVSHMRIVCARACMHRGYRPIVYPASYSKGDGCCSDSQLVLGSYRNPKLGQHFSHKGVMSHARIWKTALNSIACSRLARDRLALTTKKRLNPVSESDYWSSAAGAAPRSPSFDFSNTYREEVEIQGHFFRDSKYRMVFVSARRNLPGSVKPDVVSTCRNGANSSDWSLSSLICEVPGSDSYSMTTISVQKLSPDQEWMHLWNKVCFRKECGLTPVVDRFHSDVSPWWSYQGRLRFDLSGSLTVFRFLPSQSVIFRRDRYTGMLEPMHVLGGATACSLHTSERLAYQRANHGSCFYNARTCSSGSLQGAPCSTDSECSGSVCSDTNAFQVQGVSALTPFQHASSTMLFVSNFWNGQSLETLSPLYRIERSGNSGYSVRLVQQLETKGVLDCVHMALPESNVTMLAVANFASDVNLYSLRVGNADTPIEDGEAKIAPIGVSSPSALTSFTLHNRLFLAVACFSSGSRTAASGLFEISRAVYPEDLDREAEKRDRPLLAARRVAQVHTSAAVDVEVFVSGDNPYLFFACRTDTPSPLYRVVESFRSISVDLVQSVPCSFASKAHAFFVGSPFLHHAHPEHQGHHHIYLAVAQPDGPQGGQPVVYRWNGTSLLSDVTSYTLPKDSAGGQTLTGQRHVEALLTLRLEGSPSSAHLLLGVKTDSVSFEKAPVSQIWSGTHQGILGLHSPSAIVAAHNIPLVLVASAGSRCILAFERDAKSGMLSFNPGAGYLTNYTSQGLERNDATERDDDPEIGKSLSMDRLGYPLRGVSALTLSPDGLYVYSTSITDNLIAVFALNISSYRLRLVQVMSEDVQVGNDGGVFGLLGARSLSVSASGSSIYVAGWRDHSLSIWHRTASSATTCPGCVSFVHRLRQGERRPETFRHLPARLSPSHKGSPWVLGEHIGPSAIDGVSLRINGRLYFAVAFSPVSISPSSSDSSLSAVAIYRILDHKSVDEDLEEDIEEVLSLVQTIQEQATALAFFPIPAAPLIDKPETYYLLLGTALRWSPDGVTGGQVQLLQWNKDGFKLHHFLPFPPDPTGVPMTHMYATSIRAFKPATQYQLVAISYASPGSDAHALWCLYRWHDERPLPRSPDDGFAQPPRLELLHCSSASGSPDIETIFVQNTWMMVVANQGQDHQGLVKVYTVSDEGNVVNIQSIQAAGVSDTSLMRVKMSDGVTLVLLVIGIRRAPGSKLYGPRARPLESYDQISKVYRWEGNEHGGLGSFVWHQDLDGVTFPSVMDDFGLDDRWGKYERAASTSVYCGLGASPSDSDCVTGDDGSLMVPYLRGVTGVDYFHAEGETYLALAQSVCPLDDPACLSEPFGTRMPQPQSRLLQWNRASGRFGDILAMTDKVWQSLTGLRVPEKLLTEHSFALSLAAGRAKGFRYLEAGRRQLLLALSLSKGALLFEFRFRLVEGLRSPISVMAVPSQSPMVSGKAHAVADGMGAIYVASSRDGSIAVFQHAPTDAVSAIKRSCPSAGCLRYIASLSDATRNRLNRGLSGARYLRFATGSGCKSASQAGAVETCHDLAVEGVRPRSNLPCSFVPPLPGAAASSYGSPGPALTPPQCSFVRFELERLPPRQGEDEVQVQMSQNPSLTLSSSGVLHDLHFEVESGSSGIVRFLLRPVSELTSTLGEALELELVVVPVNSAPTFQAFDVITSQTVMNAVHADQLNSSSNSLIFAINVTDGEPSHFANQSLSWHLHVVDGGSIFSELPELFTMSSAGSQYGVMAFGADTILRPGTCNFVLALCDDGAPTSALTGSRNCSDPATVRLLVRAVNHAPFFEWTQRPTLVLYPGLATQSLVAGNISDGEPWQAEHGMQQILSFTVMSVSEVSPSHAGAHGRDEDVLNLFEYLTISSSGCLQALLRAERSSGSASPLLYRHVEVRVRLQDDGGTAWGGRDSFEAVLPIILQPLTERLSIYSPQHLSLSELTDETEHSSSTTIFPQWFTPIVPYLGESPSSTSEAMQCIALAYDSADTMPHAPSDGASGLTVTDMEVVFKVVSVSRPELFESPPQVSPSGDLSFALVGGRTGRCNITVVLEWKHTVADPVLHAKRGDNQSLPHVVHLQIQAVNFPPSFVVSSAAVALVESSPGSTSVMRNFVTNISPGRLEETHQKLSFSIVFYDAQRLFRDPPTLSATGTLLFVTSEDAHGRADFAISLRDDAGARSIEQRASVHVLPLPDILSVHPLVLPTRGNTTITIRARNLFLEPITAADEEAPGWQAEREHVYVRIGVTECQHLAINAKARSQSEPAGQVAEMQSSSLSRNDEEADVITCDAGVRVGGDILRLSVTQGHLLRERIGPRIFNSHIFVAGTKARAQQQIHTSAIAAGAGEGFVAVGPNSAAEGEWPPLIGASLAPLQLAFHGGGIKALAKVNNTIFVGGSFIHATSWLMADPLRATPASSTAQLEPMRHVGAWGLGSSVTALGLGLDGVVEAMCSLPSRSALVVGGSFTRAWNLQEPFEVLSGGLAVWTAGSDAGDGSDAARTSSSGSWGVSLLADASPHLPLSPSFCFS
jgi:hypothetical protein